MESLLEEHLFLILPDKPYSMFDTKWKKGEGEKDALWLEEGGSGFAVKVFKLSV